MSDSTLTHVPEGGRSSGISPADREPPGRGMEGEEISLIEVANLLLRHRRAVLGLPLGAAVLAVALALAVPRSYTAEASFLPQAGEGRASGLAGLAARFGVGTPSGGGGQAPEFYARLLESRPLLRAAVETEYRRPAGRGGEATPRASLLELYGVEGRSRAERVDAAVQRLEEHTKVRTDSETGVVEFSVRSRWPELSAAVADRLLELVNAFNLETRQSQASAERRFLEERLAEAQRGLEAAEDSLESFLERNRRFEHSPELRFEHDRLERRVAFRQQLYTSLAQSYEQAKAEEVRNTPVITVVEPPEVPVEADSRRLLLRGVLGLIVGGMLGAFWAFGREFVARARRDEPEEYREFTELRRQLGAELGGTWRRLRRAVRPGGPD